MLHAFEHLDEEVSQYNIEHQQLSEDTTDCGVCDLLFESSATPPTLYEYPLITGNNFAEEIVSYTFLTDHKNLSFSLRGPPSIG